MEKEKNISDITAIGETDFRAQRRRFGIKLDDRRRHMYIVGKTGTGKSTTLENMIIEDIRDGRGVGLVDPHGELAEKIMKYIPSYRVNDVVYVNPADMEYPVAFNILETVDEKYKHLVSSGLMGVFKKIWPDVWSARMEYILNNTILALLDYPGSTMLGVNRMLSDKTYRQKVIERIKDPIVRAFWAQDFAKWQEKYANEAVAPIQNKVGQFLSAAMIRNIVGQVKSTVNIRNIMDTKKILIMNLSKGRIGEDNSRLLGGMLITKIQMSAMERIDMPEEDRNDFFLYVDEFQNFATESFANILSEARKYRLSLTVAHQYIEQITDEKVRGAIFGNVGTMVIFRIGAADADFLEKEFAPRLTPEDLVNLPKFHFYVKLMIDGIVSDPFSARGLPPVLPEEQTGNEEKIIAVSRERFSAKREVVEDKIARWSQPFAESAESAPYGEKKRKKTDDKKIFEAQCSNCGSRVALNFQPDGVRPVYCDTCFEKIKEQRKMGKPPVPVALPAAQSRGMQNAPQRTGHAPVPRERTAQPPPSAPSVSLKELTKKKPTSFTRQPQSFT